MASEKQNFEKAIGYIKYELNNSNTKNQEYLKQELSKFSKQWSYTQEEIEKIKPATIESIKKDYMNDILGKSEYIRPTRITELLENDFDSLIKRYEISIRAKEKK